MLAKSEEEKKNDEDDYETWAIMGDKGFEGLEHVLRTISPFKSVRGRPYSDEETKMNELIGSSRVIVENYYGRMKEKFKISCTIWLGASKLRCCDRLLYYLDQQ